LNNYCKAGRVESTRWTASWKKIIINADDDDNDNDDMSESTVSCDDNDDIQGVVPIVNDSE
jgi:hypothetical protein